MTKRVLWKFDLYILPPLALVCPFCSLAQLTRACRMVKVEILIVSIGWNRLFVRLFI